MQEGYTLEGVLDYDHFGHTLAISSEMCDVC